MSSHKIHADMIWIDVEGTQYWKDHTYNRQFVSQLVGALGHHGHKIGMYTSKYQWEPIMGSYTFGGNLPLWYAHYDNVQSFNDFRAFGGWKKPAIKQFKGTTNICGASIDKSFY
eukprot:TRINITY_DN35_c0_g1_i2.p2 TRINITY_DN35_c0_g1~~TRINITY_DN35_c0_g1_i2.p2  ORF type:complete len:114 (+),score=24.33 TRINITY_DN35_c0_g1_i2:190-531(+)